MEQLFDNLIEKFLREENQTYYPVTLADIDIFEQTSKCKVPQDLRKYFLDINGTKNYGKDFFQFNSLEQFLAIEDYFDDWEGIPNYKSINPKLAKSCYVIANYQLHLYSYAIYLRQDEDKNKVFVICGDQYNFIAKNFSEFIQLYLNNDPSLFL
jgi:hypothetical protein